jgi:hypothetical protein
VLGQEAPPAAGVPLSPGSWPHRSRPRRTTPILAYQVLGKRFGSLTCETESHKLFHKWLVNRVLLCDTYKEYIPSRSYRGFGHDYNMSTENEILDSKTSAPANRSSKTDIQEEFEVSPKFSTI